MSKSRRPDRPGWKPLSQPPLTVEIVGKRHDILAVSKPVGMDTIQQNGWKTGYPRLIDVVYDKYPQARFLNRIDRYTSGVVLFGLSKRRRTYLSNAWFGAGNLDMRRKIYLAVILQPEWETWETEEPLRKAGKYEEAHSKFDVLQKRGELALVSAELVSHGRTHQLRKHLALSGHPIVGDTKYGGLPWPRQGQLLHSWVNAVKLEDGSWVEFRSKVPKDFPLTVEGGTCIKKILVPGLTRHQQIKSYEDMNAPRLVDLARDEGEAYSDYVARRAIKQRARDKGLCAACGTPTDANCPRPVGKHCHRDAVRST